MRFENASIFTDKVLRSALPLREGELFSASAIREGLTRIIFNAYSQARGYIDFTSQLVTSFAVSSEAHRIDIIFRLRCLAFSTELGCAAIHGLDHATEEVLRSKLEAGQVFDATTLNQFLKDSNRKLLPTGAPSYE